MVPIAIIRDRVWQEIPADKLYNMQSGIKKTDQGYLEWQAPDDLHDEAEDLHFVLECKPSIDTRGQAEELPGMSIRKRAGNTRPPGIWPEQSQ